MRGQLLDLCLLAYPRALRRRDRDYLRDLALELAERHGLVRQVISLLLGGVRERVSSAGRWGRRLGAASLAGVALAFGGLVVSAGAHGSHEVDRFACAASGVGGGSGCAAHARSLVFARERTGWRCTTPGDVPDALHVSLRCTRDR
jgi:hypothetical protein